jgi:hypothetical protein
MYAKGTGALVKVVDVLGAEIESIAQLLFKFCEGNVGSFGLAARASRRRIQ